MSQSKLKKKGKKGCLLYSTKNSTQSVMAYMAKESKRVDICTWITESLSGIPGGNTTL